MLTSIAFIIPYFGHFNCYFQLWLNSCAKNPSIHWFIFTDDKREFDYPQNVHVEYTTLQETKKRFEKVLLCNVNLKHAYKLCDLKPFYGEVYADYLKGFDFWGYCDIDLIWGNIRKFIKDDILLSSDKVFSYGHCTLMRNIKKINQFYHLQADDVASWKKVVSEPYSFYYDESDQINGIFDKYFANRFYKGCFGFDARLDVRSLFPTRHTIDELHTFKAKYIFSWDNGRLVGYCTDSSEGTLKAQEFMYLHLQKRQMCNNIGHKKIEKFIITNKYFMHYEEVTYKNFKRFLPRYSIVPYGIKDKLKTIVSIIIDNKCPQPYFRSNLRYIFDRIFGRSNRYFYDFMRKRK